MSSDPIDFLRDEGVAFKRHGEHHHVREGWLGLDCPFCGPASSRFHLGLNLRSLAFHCWKCGKMDAKRVLGSLRIDCRAFYQLRTLNHSAQPPENRSYPSIHAVLREPKGRGPLGNAHRAYLRRRGFDSDKLVRIWDLEGIGLAARLRWRIYIPIVLNGIRVSWSTRAIGDHAPLRYISAAPEEEKAHIKTLLYGADLCGHSVVIVEGPADVWRIGPGAVALFGTSYTTAQLRRVLQFPRRCIVFDSEPTAQRRAHELARELMIFPGRTEVIELDAKDPGSASLREIKLLRRAAGL